MRFLAVLVLLCGLALAGGATFFAYNQYSTVRPAAGPVTVEVIAANTRLEYGTRLTPENLMWQAVLKESLPAGAFTSRSALLGDDGETVRIVTRTIEEGEPVLASRISEPNVLPRVAQSLSDGKRAFTIRIDAVTGVGGFISPGDRVDILLTTRDNRNLVSNVILQNIPVIAVDQEADTESIAPKVGRTATVEVTPTEAQKLDLAQQLGKLSLTLRAVSGQAVAGTSTPPSDLIDAPTPITARDLLGKPVEPEEIAPERPMTTVIVRKGTEVSTFEADKK